MPGQWKAFVAFYAGDSVASACSCRCVRMLTRMFQFCCSLGRLRLRWAYARLVLVEVTAA